MKLADLMEDGRRLIRCGVLECGAQIFPLGEAGLVAAAAAGWDIRGALLASTDADLCPGHALPAQVGSPWQCDGMAESREIIEVKVSVPVLKCDRCGIVHPYRVMEARDPFGTGYELPAGVLACVGYQSPQGWEQISIPGLNRLSLCGSCVPVVVEHLRKAALAAKVRA